MIEIDIKGFRKDVDEDAGLRSKRNVLTTLSVILIAINYSGAVIKEANTFIFKIEFTNEQGITGFLALCILFLMVRYYAYAHPYHEKLFSIWARRMMSDRFLFYYDEKKEQVGGLIGKSIDLYIPDEPEVLNAEYRVVGLFKRALTYEVSFQDGADAGVSVNYHNLFELSKKWTLIDYMKMLRVEARYQLEAFIKHRENLDLVAPYILGICSVLSFVYRESIF